MVGVSFDLGRPAGMALDDEAGRVAVDAHRGGVVLRDAGRELRPVVDVRQNVLGRQARAAIEPRERDARPCEPQELASIEDRIEQVVIVVVTVVVIVVVMRVVAHLAHRWQVVQSVSRCTPCARINASAPESLAGSAAAINPMVVTSARGRRFGAGSRWQLTHHPIDIGVTCTTRAIWSTRP